MNRPTDMRGERVIAQSRCTPLFLAGAAVVGMVAALYLYDEVVKTLLGQISTEDTASYLHQLEVDQRFDWNDR